MSNRPADPRRSWMPTRGSSAAWGLVLIALAWALWTGGAASGETAMVVPAPSVDEPLKPGAHPGMPNRWR